ncbi:hypothetical protein M9H77_04338 [Catharanthus roseus]|uniref:Uncharacterized protein n=1 Tax=Catharanthus roseus TaxID=4058 RepID=A0ACC0CDY7_CATRO|nr:hypothetical protein M9H77_04338 [Catharanthus roseus]
MSRLYPFPSSESEPRVSVASNDMILMDFNEERIRKRRRNSEEKEEEENLPNHVDSLPQEVAFDIISRLPIKSLIQFRFVCKSWENLSYDPNLVNLHLSKALKGNLCLIFHCDFPIKNFLYFVEFSPNSYEKEQKLGKFEIPFSNRMAEFNVIGSCNGLLCLVNSLLDETLYIYNPFTSKFKELPKPTPVYQDQIVMYGFGFHPITNQYKVIKITYYPNALNLNSIHRPGRGILLLHRHSNSSVQVFCVGKSSNQWRNIGKIPYKLQKNCSPVLLNGRLHWTANQVRNQGQHNPGVVRIVSFDLSDELFREIESPELGTHVYIRRDYHISSLGGCLCIVVPLRGTSDCSSLDIWVMKEYDMKESWVKEFNIGAFCPNFISQQDLYKSRGVWRSILTSRMIRVLCLLKNGDILLQYKGGTLVSYNPKNGLFNNITFPNMPKFFQTVPHIGSLNWVDSSS